MLMALRMLPIARPCGESFAEMPGDERTRFCAKCNQEVHDLSAGTEEEAGAIFRRAGGKRACVRFARDASGAVRFGLAAAAALSLAACSAAVPDAPVTPAAADYDMGDAIPDTPDRCPDDPSANPDDGCPAVDAGARPSSAPDR